MQSSEETVVVFRGPFVSSIVDHPLASGDVWTSQSTLSTDLQILDQQVGIMDITYSTAWQLGKTLAIADQAATAALSRIRTTIHDEAMKLAKAEVMDSLSKTAADVIPGLPQRIEMLGTLHITSNGPTHLQRWNRVTDKEPLDITF